MSYDGSSLKVAPDDPLNNASTYENKRSNTDSSNSDPYLQNKGDGTGAKNMNIVFPQPMSSKSHIEHLTVYEARQINGCLIRAPTTFYTDIW